MLLSRHANTRFEDGLPTADDLAVLPAVSQVSEQGGGCRLYTETPGRAASQVVKLAEEKGLNITHLCTRKPSLEDVFLHLTTERVEETRT